MSNDEKIAKTEKELEPSKELQEALEELDDMEKHPEKYKSYTNIEDLKKRFIKRWYSKWYCLNKKNII